MPTFICPSIFLSVMIVLMLVLAIRAAQEVKISAEEFVIGKLIKQIGKQTTLNTWKLSKQYWSRGSYRYTIDYDFYDVEGRLIVNKQEINSEHYFELDKELNEPIYVGYLASMPEISRLTGIDEDNATRNYATIVTILFSIFIPVIPIFWIIFYKQAFDRYSR